MSLTKYAEFEVLSAQVAQRTPLGTIQMRTTAGSSKTAHRANFTYDPRPGYLYVRSRAISSRCNDNFDAFPAEEIKKAWATFVGKPVFVNHKNANHRRARGVIIDAALHEDTNPDGTPDTWVEVLMEVDAVRFPVLAEAVEKGDIARTSMGTDVQYSICTACGNRAATPADYCQHIPRMKGMKIVRRTASGGSQEVLIAEECYGLGFFENSLLVEPPADPTAFVLGVENGNLPKAASRVNDDVQRMAVANYRPVKIKAREIQEGDRLDIGGKTRVDARHPRTDKVLVRTKTNGVRSPSVKSWDHDDDVTVYRKQAARLATFADKVKVRREDLEYQPRAEDVVRTALLTANRRVAALKESEMIREAYGETKAPAKVDTMRAENCPVCSDDSGFNGDRCNVCGYTKPPAQFGDPDLEKAQQVDLRQEQGDGTQAVDPVTGEPIEGQPGDDGADLQCTNCGEVFSGSEGQPEAEEAPKDPTDPDADPQQPGKPQDPQDPQESLEDLGDLSDADLGLADDEDDQDDSDDLDDDEPEDDVQNGFGDDGEVDPDDDQDDDQLGDQALINGDPEQDPTDPADLDAPVQVNGTCPICGEGTLVPADQAAPTPTSDVDPTKATAIQPKPKPAAGTTKTTASGRGTPTPAPGRGVSKDASRDMGNRPTPNQAKNAAAQRRSQIVAAIVEQQGVIEEQHRVIASQAQQIRGLTDAVGQIAVAAGLGKHAAFEGIVRAAGLSVEAAGNCTACLGSGRTIDGSKKCPDCNGTGKAGSGARPRSAAQHLADSAQNPEGTPSSTTQDAKTPQATDDVTKPGAAPSTVNQDVTPLAVTDVQSTNVAAPDAAATLNNLVDVTAPVAGTDAVVPAAGDAGGTSTVNVGTPSDTTFDSTGPQWTASQTIERHTASLRLARLRITAGIAQGEDLAIGEQIAKSAATVGEINAEATALSRLASASTTQVTPERTRGMVPRRAAAGIQPMQQPSMRSEATATGAEDEWAVGGIDL